MAEKNTLSILETIKKKMNKFDQQPAKDADKTSVDNDFNLDDLDLDDETNIVPKQSAPAKNLDEISEIADDEAKEFLEDFGEDDLENFADDDVTEEPQVLENSKSEELEKIEIEEKNPAIELPKEKIKTAEIIAETADSEEILSDEEMLQAVVPNELESVVEEKIIEEKKVEEKTAEIPLEKEVEKKSKDQKNELENFDFTVENKESETASTAPSPITENNQKQENIEEEFKLDDDLELDKIEVKSDVVKPEKTLNEMSDDELLKSLDAEAFKEINPAENDQNSELNLSEIRPTKTSTKIPTAEEIDLEFEKEIMGLKPSLQNKVEEKTKQVFATDFNQQIEQKFTDKNPLSLFDDKKNSPKNSNLIYDSTIRQSGESIKKLIDAKNIVNGISTFSQNPAFAEIAVRLMEPKLEKWLNDNLPELVENIVREEISKIIPK